MWLERNPAMQNMEKLALLGGTPVRSRLLPYAHQTIDSGDIAGVGEALSSSLITQGPTLERFERALAGRARVKHAGAFLRRRLRGPAGGRARRHDDALLPPGEADHDRRGRRRADGPRRPRRAAPHDAPPRDPLSRRRAALARRDRRARQQLPADRFPGRARAESARQARELLAATRPDRPALSGAAQGLAVRRP